MGIRKIAFLMAGCVLLSWMIGATHPVPEDVDDFADADNLFSLNPSNLSSPALGQVPINPPRGIEVNAGDGFTLIDNFAVMRLLFAVQVAFWRGNPDAELQAQREDLVFKFPDGDPHALHLTITAPVEYKAITWSLSVMIFKILNINNGKTYDPKASWKAPPFYINKDGSRVLTVLCKRQPRISDESGATNNSEVVFSKREDQPFSIKRNGTLFKLGNLPEVETFALGQSFDPVEANISAPGPLPPYTGPKVDIRYQFLGQRQSLFSSYSLIWRLMLAIPFRRNHDDQLFPSFPPGKVVSSKEAPYGGLTKTTAFMRSLKSTYGPQRKDLLQDQLADALFRGLEMFNPYRPLQELKAENFFFIVNVVGDADGFVEAIAGKQKPSNGDGDDN